MNKIQKDFIEAKILMEETEKKINEERNRLCEKQNVDLNARDNETINLFIDIDNACDEKYNWVKIRKTYVYHRDKLFKWAEKKLKEYDPEQFKQYAICFSSRYRFIYEDKLIDICLSLKEEL